MPPICVWQPEVPINKRPVKPSAVNANFDLIFISISPVLPVFNRIMQILSVRTTHYFLSVGNMKRIYWK